MSTQLLIEVSWSTSGNKMPLKAELDAVEKNYVELMKLPVKDLLPALKKVVSYLRVWVFYVHCVVNAIVTTWNETVL